MDDALEALGCAREIFSKLGQGCTHEACSVFHALGNLFKAKGDVVTALKFYGMSGVTDIPADSSQEQS